MKMNFSNFFSDDIPTSKPEFHIPGLEYELKPDFDELIPSLRGWGQNVLLLGQSNSGKSYFLKKLLEVMRPKRLYVISNTSPEQYRQEGTLIKHYSVMPESFDDTNIEPESYVIIQGSKNLFSNTCQGGSKWKVLVAKVAVKLKFQSTNRQMQRNALLVCV